ncbi:MAG: pyridoxal phosphate-dependent aminotransferase family protein [Elusimicrobiota bacterium]
MDIFDKCYSFNTAKRLMERDIFPYFIPLASAQGPQIKVGDRELIMLGSNNYLGLAGDPEMKRAAQDAVAHWGTGCGGSRFLNGTMELHHETELKLAKFKRREAALIFSTGYQTNLGVLSCLAGRKDVVIVDKGDHASIIDGGRLSWGETLRYRHNDMDHLEQILRGIPADRGKLIAVDGVFSMEGDIADLPGIVAAARRHGARIVLDDAHSTGVLGLNGRGTCEHFGLENNEVDLIVGTCSKALGSVGGFVAGDKDVIHYIQLNARSMMFSAALPPACVAAISRAIDFIQDEPERRARLWDNAQRLRTGLQSLGLSTGVTETPIVPIEIGDDEEVFRFWRLAFDAGIFNNPIITPAVLPGHSLIRNTLMATHTAEHIDRALELFEHCGKKAGLLPRPERDGVSIAA